MQAHVNKPNLKLLSAQRTVVVIPLAKHFGHLMRNGTFFIV